MLNKFGEFSELMEERLREKQPMYGNSWRFMCFEALKLRLVEEVSKFLLADFRMKAEKKLVDVASLAYLIWLRLNEVEKES